MSDYGAKVSKSGVDVKIADPADLTYSSKWSNFKIHSILSKNVTMGGTINTFYSDTIDNPLSYSPLFMCYARDPNNTTDWYPAVGYGMTGGSGLPLCTYNPTTNKFTVGARVYASGINKTFNFKIVVFIDILTGTSANIAAVDNYGMKISKTGKTTSDKDTDMSFFSKYGNLTVASSSTVSASGGTETITHSLGYCPIAMAFIQEPYDTTQYDPIPTGYQSDDPPGSGGGPGSVQYHVTTTTMVINYTVPQNGNNVPFKYLIFN